MGWINRFHAYNIGHLSSKACDPIHPPCTPTGAIHLLKSTGVPIAGANIVVLGRSDIVGSPVTSMLRNLDATVTQCHSRTKNLPEIVSLTSWHNLHDADLVISDPSSNKRISSSRRLANLDLFVVNGSNQVQSSLTSASTTFQVNCTIFPISFVHTQTNYFKNIY